jgi:hypothetical protein
MIELVIAACLATGECKETRLPYDPQDVSLMTCMMAGQVEVARWYAQHPAWQIKRWRCGIGDRAASRSVSGRQLSELSLPCSQTCGEATLITAGGEEESSVTALHHTAIVPFWRTITLGTYRTPGDLRDALRRKRIAIGHTASALLDLPSLPLSRAEMLVDLAVLSVEELGFGADGASLADINLQARRRGLELCSPEVAFQLPLQYRRQPIGEFLLIAMEPLVTPAGDPVALLVANGGAGQIIVGRRADPDDLIGPTMKLVFVVSR